MFQNGLKGQALTPLFFAFCFGMVLSTMLNQHRLETANDTRDDSLMTYRGLDKTIEDLPQDLADKLAQAFETYQYKRDGLLADAALRLKLLEYASTENLSIDQAAQALYSVDPVSDSEVSGYYAMHRAELNRPFYEVKSMIRKRLSFEKAKEKRAQILRDLYKKGDLMIHPASR